MQRSTRNLLITIIALGAMGAAIFLFAEENRHQVTAPPVARVASQPLQHYIPTTVLSASYGTGPGEVGLDLNRTDAPPLGPQSFAISDGQILIADTVNGRLLRYETSGRYLSAFTVGAVTDIAVASDGKVVLAEPSDERLLVMNSSTRAIATGQAVDRLSIGASGTVGYTDGAAHRRRVNVDSATVLTDSEAPSYAVDRTSDRSALVTDTASGEKFEVTTDEYLGTLNVLGRDDARNIYFVIEEVPPGDELRVVKTVRKYAPTGDLRAVVPVAIDYAAHPVRELLLSPDGTIYHLRPLRDRLLIEAWREVGG